MVVVVVGKGKDWSHTRFIKKRDTGRAPAGVVRGAGGWNNTRGTRFCFFYRTSNNNLVSGWAAWIARGGGGVEQHTGHQVLFLLPDEQQQPRFRVGGMGCEKGGGTIHGAPGFVSSTRLATTNSFPGGRHGERGAGV